jgi:hypothetical protein
MALARNVSILSYYKVFITFNIDIYLSLENHCGRIPELGSGKIEIPVCQEFSPELVL